MLKGKQTWVFANRPVLTATATVVGPDEGEGPLAADFDLIHPDLMMEQKSWEKAEQLILEQASRMVLTKAEAEPADIQMYIGGDLMNQIISSSFAVRGLGIPYLGVFGACSTSMESLALAAQLVDSGAARQVIAATSSHNCTAEKQFRYPTEYGAQKAPTAQNTITGAGAGIICSQGNGPVITSATIGRVVDLGIKDPNNMGAAMAPAAVDTIVAHLRDRGVGPGYYDMIVTGDLAAVGHDIATEMLKEQQVRMEQTEFADCGLMIYDRDKQQMFAGGSGCGCSAVVTYGHLVKRLNSGSLRRILVVATGALLSPISYQQGESIPCIAHAVSLERGDLQ